jgi:hypothetical protein
MHLFFEWAIKNNNLGSSIIKSIWEEAQEGGFRFSK